MLQGWSNLSRLYYKDCHSHTNEEKEEDFRQRSKSDLLPSLSLT